MLIRIVTIGKFMEWWYEQDPTMMAKALIHHRDKIPVHKGTITVKSLIDMTGQCRMPIDLIMSRGDSPFLEYLDITPDACDGDNLDLLKLHPETMVEWIDKLEFNVVLDCVVLASDEDEAREMAIYEMDDAEVTEND